MNKVEGLLFLEREREHIQASIVAVFSVCNNNFHVLSILNKLDNILNLIKYFIQKTIGENIPSVK